MGRRGDWLGRGSGGIPGLLGAIWISASLGCGGAEFVAGSGPEDGGVDATTIDATAPPDGAADVTAPPDGARDGSGPDSGKIDGGGADAGDAGDAGPFVFQCPSPDVTAIFCSTFDKQPTPPWEWASDPLTPKAAEGVDTINYLSAPNGFAASNKLLIVTDTAQIASLGKPLTTIASHIDYSFHMYVAKYDTTTNPTIPFAGLTIGPSTPAAFSLEVSLKAGEMSLDQIFPGDGGPQTTSTAVAPIPTAGWVKVGLLLDRSGANWIATVFLDDVKKLQAQTAVTPSDQNLEIDLGILEVLPPSTPNALTFDNVLVRAY
jgi:hypothetical protein